MCTKMYFYLNNPRLSKKISKAGKIKVTKILKASNDMLIRKITNTAFKNKLMKIKYYKNFVKIIGPVWINMLID